jgi:hypothetical protein
VRVRVTVVAVEQQVLDTAYVFVALVIQYAMHIPHITLSCALSASTTFFYIIPQKALLSIKNIEIECVLIFTTTFI